MNIILDTNVFIKNKDNLPELIKYIEDKGLILSILEYTILELKSSNNEDIIENLFQKENNVHIIRSEVKGFNGKLFEESTIKKNNIENYKCRKKEYELMCIFAVSIYISLSLAELCKKTDYFKLDINELEKYLETKNVEDSKNFVNEYLKKLSDEMKIHYYGEKNFKKTFKQQWKSKKAEIAEKIKEENKKNNIYNQNEFMRDLICSEYLEIAFRIIENNNIDKNTFIDIALMGSADTKKRIMTSEKMIIEKLKKYSYVEDGEYNGATIMKFNK